MFPKSRFWGENHDRSCRLPPPSIPLLNLVWCKTRNGRYHYLSVENAEFTSLNRLKMVWGCLWKVSGKIDFLTFLVQNDPKTEVVGAETPVSDLHVPGTNPANDNIVGSSTTIPPPTYSTAISPIFVRGGEIVVPQKA